MTLIGLVATIATTLVFIGAGERNRTLDLLITNELLYRLSYIGTAENYIRAL